jgi:hypothetical protein
MNYKTISEELLKRAAEIMGPDSNFHIALKWGNDYREAGMTPVYYTNDDEHIVYVTTEEKMNGVTLN